MLARRVVVAHDGQDCVFPPIEGAITNRTEMNACDVGVGDCQPFRNPAGGDNGAGSNVLVAVIINSDKGIFLMTETFQSGHRKKSTFALSLLKRHRTELGAGNFFHESGKIRQVLNHVSAAARDIADNDNLQTQPLAE